MAHQWTRHCQLQGFSCSLLHPFRYVSRLFECFMAVVWEYEYSSHLVRTEVLFNLTRGGIFALILFIIALKKYFVPFLFISLVCAWCFVCFFFLLFISYIFLANTPIYLDVIYFITYFVRVDTCNMVWRTLPETISYSGSWNLKWAPIVCKRTTYVNIWVYSHGKQFSGTWNYDLERKYVFFCRKHLSLVAS